ncbi:MAG: heavy-metal-associated domain-containing protein [Gemmataceae bacterium]|nr:heavy-metal-associated domain-containing protein [Planctomycetia bacterium]MBX3401310.1 heavy-metal-associated domain-containing protein [Gemmataceae bacterium]
MIIQTTLNTHGIKCEGCAAAARIAVEKLPGVETIQFDLPGKTVTVTHDDTVVRTDVARALSQAGYPSE